MPAAPSIRPAPVSSSALFTCRISPIENHLDLWPILQHLDQLFVHASPFPAHDQHRFPVRQKTIRTVPADRRGHSRIIRGLLRAQVLSTPSTHSLHDFLLKLTTSSHRSHKQDLRFCVSRRTGFPANSHATPVPARQAYSANTREPGTRAICDAENRDVTGSSKKAGLRENPKWLNAPREIPSNLYRTDTL